MSWHRTTFCLTGPLWGESTSHCDWWIPHTKGQQCGALLIILMFNLRKLLNKQSSFWGFEIPQSSCDITLISHFLKIKGLVQDCSNSIANALELLQSCTKPSKYFDTKRVKVNSSKAMVRYSNYTFTLWLPEGTLPQVLNLWNGLAHYLTWLWFY